VWGVAGPTSDAAVFQRGIEGLEEGEVRSRGWVQSDGVAGAAVLRGVVDVVAVTVHADAETHGLLHGRSLLEAEVQDVLRRVVLGIREVEHVARDAAEVALGGQLDVGGWQERPFDLQGVVLHGRIPVSDGHPAAAVVAVPTDEGEVVVPHRVPAEQGLGLGEPSIFERRAAALEDGDFGFARVGHDEAAPIGRQAERVGEFVGAIGSGDQPHELPGRPEDLDHALVRVQHRQLSAVEQRDVLRLDELPFAEPPPAQGGQVSAPAVQVDDASLERIREVHPPLPVCRQAARRAERKVVDGGLGDPDASLLVHQEHDVFRRGAHPEQAGRGDRDVGGVEVRAQGHGCGDRPVARSQRDQAVVAGVGDPDDVGIRAEARRVVQSRMGHPSGRPIRLEQADGVRAEVGHRDGTALQDRHRAGLAEPIGDRGDLTVPVAIAPHGGICQGQGKQRPRGWMPPMRTGGV